MLAYTQRLYMLRNYHKTHELSIKEWEGNNQIYQKI